jgi:RND superfamily putative drug exporter
MERLARFVIRNRRAVLVGALVSLFLAGAFGGNVATHLKSGGFENPSAPSTKAKHILEQQFNQGDPNLVFLVTAKGGNVDDPAVAAAGRALTERLSNEAGVSLAVSYWTLNNAPPLKSTKGHQALVLARVAGTDDVVDTRVGELTPKYVGSDGTITVAAGGIGPLFREVSKTIERDLAKAELIAIPITLLLLVFVFRGVIAATLPIGIGVLAILGTFLTLRILAAMTSVSIFALNMVTAMGLALAIDYALFVVTRFREEMRNGLSVEDAIVRSMTTAGRTVLFSAATVAISLSALLIFPLFFLRSFAYGGIAVVAIAAAGATIVLPALLAVTGHRVGRAAQNAKATDEGFWHRAAIFVMRRPIPIALAIMALVFVLGAPFLNMKLGVPDDRVLPPGAAGRVVSDQLRDNFASNEASALSVVLPAAPATGDIESYAAAVSKVRGVARVDALTGSYVNGLRVFPAGPQSFRFVEQNGTWLSVVPSVEPMSLAGEQMVKDVRAVSAPTPALVGGASAQLVDAKASLFSLLPWALAIIAVITFTVLFLMFGSLLVPAKAVILNLLSLSATYGAMVWIFQEGHFHGALGFTPTGTLVVTVPILMFCIAFGLSMDYEVFLLSRIKEEHDRGAGNTASVAVGLEKTGGLISAAAALMAIVFVAMGTSQVSFIKLFGLGLALAVVMDATLIRGALVPAFMRLAGNANWWAPAPLKRLYDRFGISESHEGTLMPVKDELYRRGVIKAAKACSSDDELYALLDEENLTVDELLGWGAPASLLQGASS